MEITRVNRVPLFIASFFFAVMFAAPSIALAQKNDPTQRPYDPYDQQDPYQREQLTASARIQFEPNDAEVYVDGRLAGRVDDFDSFFQRLRVTPGNHQIAIWREGYRTEFHNVYFAQDSTRQLNGRMERLRPGMVSGPRPGRGRGYAYGQPPWAGGPQNDRYAQNDRNDRAQFGTVTLSIPVSDAQVFVNGTRRNLQRRGNRVDLNLEPGRHYIEVRRAGYEPFARQIMVRPGATINVNVPMRRG